ncbi:hypothetical protein KHQ84_gp074 [Rhodococcus phage Finch]|uniref:Uncharacterized protein n=1 Tax=Rhodococcus phage Finch TaxID=2094144 RepID=A0A2P1JXY6_9CAUD|nr:hypothetical protein KHQ84_gp074 [Rhodococcus phage Finch]AVO25172.1 hypothetical protein SEA_FINCH_74 [Rhodococcus phage Finch]
MATASEDAVSPSYYVPPAVSPMVEELMATSAEQEAAFLAKQQAQGQQAQETSDRMGDGGTPEEKRPV